ncbi:hypothetical protein FRC00_003162, partial [Tulasnella sp. 408]
HRFQRLRITASAKGEDVYEYENRDRAARVWREYCSSMVDEWKVTNVIAAILLTAAITFLMGSSINEITYYALLYCIISALGSIAHAAYYARKFRTRLNEESYSLLQLDHYLCHYCTLDNILISIPLVEFLYALGAFLVSVLAHLWSHATELSEKTLKNERLASRVVLLAFVSLQFVSLLASVISCQSLFLEATWMLDEEKREIRAHLGCLRDKAARDREALYSSMPTFHKPENRDTLEPFGDTAADSNNANHSGSVQPAQTQEDRPPQPGIDHTIQTRADETSNKSEPEYAHIANGGHERHRSGQRQVPGWHRKIVQHPSEAIPFGFEGTPENINDIAGTIGQLYVGKVELKHGDRMIIEGALSVSLRRYRFRENSRLFITTATRNSPNKNL